MVKSFNMDAWYLPAAASARSPGLREELRAWNGRVRANRVILQQHKTASENSTTNSKKFVILDSI